MITGHNGHSSRHSPVQVSLDGLSGPVLEQHRQLTVTQCWVLWCSTCLSQAPTADAYLFALCLCLLGTKNKLTINELQSLAKKILEGNNPEVPEAVKANVIAHLGDHSVWQAVAKDVSCTGMKNLREKRLVTFEKLVMRAAEALYIGERTVVLSQIGGSNTLQLVYRRRESGKVSNSKGEKGNNSGSTGIRCAAFDAYRAELEPEPGFVNGSESLLDDRGYKFLLHAIEYASFKRYRAFDLSFCRWGELEGHPKREQVVNLSSQIFEAIPARLGKADFVDFHRILVVSAEQLARPSASVILSRIAGAEDKWRSEFGADKIESRLLIYNNDHEQRELRHDMMRHNDFVLFLSGEEEFAIIEPGLRHPKDHENRNNMMLEANLNREQITSRERVFYRWWVEAIPLPEYLVQCAIGPTNLDSPA